MYKTCLIPLLILIHISVAGQTVRSPVAAPYLGMGAYSINHVDVFSFTSNQASLAQMKFASAAAYGEKRFLLQELGLYQAAVAVPTSSGNFGFNAGYYGTSDYNETQLGLAYGRKLGDKVDIGVQFNYNNILINGYGSASAISFELGTILHITDNLHAGFHAYNPVGGKFGKEGEEKLPSIYSFGLGYEASEKFLFSTEIQKEENKNINVNAGLQYKFLPQLMARLGVATGSSIIYAGLGFSLKYFRLDVVSSFHQQLGISPGMMILYDFKKKGN